MDKESPPYTKRLCCTKPELTVYMSGTIKNASNENLKDWLRKIVSPPICFEYIAKRDPNIWGHVHFRTHDFASKFYYAMEGKTFSRKLKDSTQFEDTAYQEYQPYALFELHENRQDFYVIKFHTPGVNHKEQVEIDVNDDDKSITINARGLEIEQSGSVIFNNLLTKFEVNIDLQKKVNLNEEANVVVENSISTVQLKMVNNKRKIPIA
ncbi:hypothetical protein RhiirA4_417868 [Rhizophagus irregularis]|uniref:Uncharacterized protein n=1 Tax=Rhizophagus irregularis TaxID=588596 RepID=A0A2I1G8H5_9GLOM|nr:hypothetical protein RhiirA4_417868 [Rhizophagus irregularis]